MRETSEDDIEVGNGGSASIVSFEYGEAASKIIARTGILRERQTCYISIR